MSVQEFEKGIKQDEFNKILADNPYVVVDIFTVWCGPCQMMKPIFKNLAEKFKQVKFISVDLDYSEWLARHPEYGTDAIPTFLMLKNGKLVLKRIGGMFEDKFTEEIKKKLLN